MIPTKFIICLAAVFSVAFAAPGRGRIISIDDEFVPISVRAEESSFFIEESNAGFGRITRTGLSVTKGASGILDFDITVKAIDAERLSSMDASFESTLTAAERSEYNSLKRSFKGGLKIPFLNYIGANLDEKVTREKLEDRAESITDYASKASAAEEILDSVVDTRIRITGTLEATGVSFIPTVAFAFIRLARVKFEDGSSQFVVSNDANDLTAASRGGDELPSKGKKLNILLG